MERILAGIILVLGFAGLIWQAHIRTQGAGSTVEVVAISEEPAERETPNQRSPLDVGDKLARYDIVRGQNGYLAIQSGATRVSFSERSEWQILAVEPTLSIYLLTGRVVTEGPIHIETPWADIWSDVDASVMHAAHLRELQILPLSSSVRVENPDLSLNELTKPLHIIGDTSETLFSNDTFDPTTSSAAAFYAWASSLEWVD